MKKYPARRCKLCLELLDLHINTTNLPTSSYMHVSENLSLNDYETPTWDTNCDNEGLIAYVSEVDTLTEISYVSVK